MFEILNRLKKKRNLPQAVSEEVNKEFEENKPEFPYDINNVSSPILIIAEKWKNNPKRVKVGDRAKVGDSVRDGRVLLGGGTSTKYVLTDRFNKVELFFAINHIISMGSNASSGKSMKKYSVRFCYTSDITINKDECNYLLSECKEALETRCNLVQSRYDRLRECKKVLKESEERRRIQKLFEEK